MISLALHKIHQQGYIHRDIKLENLLLTAKDEIFVCDLGGAIKLEEAAIPSTIATGHDTTPGGDDTDE